MKSILLPFAAAVFFIDSVSPAHAPVQSKINGAAQFNPIFDDTEVSVTHPSAFPSVGRFITEDGMGAHGVIVFSIDGKAVNPFILTAYHVVGDRAKDTAFMTWYVGTDGQIYEVLWDVHRFPYADPKKDIASLPINGSLPEGIQGYNLSRQGLKHNGQFVKNVRVDGDGSEVTYTFASICSDYHSMLPYCENFNFVEIYAYKGDSGSPVFDKDGNIVAALTNQILSTDGKNTGLSLMQVDYGDISWKYERGQYFPYAARINAYGREVAGYLSRGFRSLGL